MLFKVGRAAPKRARVRRARIKPEAHSYINVKTCTIEFIGASVETKGQKQTYEYCAFQPVGFSVCHNIGHDVDCGSEQCPVVHLKCASPDIYSTFASIVNTKTVKGP